MANEIRVRQNFLGGKVDDNPLTSTATVLNSSALAAAVAIGSTQHMPIILDPDGLGGAPEIAYVTAHTASATSATILRGQEGTTARAHNQDVDWIHGATATDFALTKNMIEWQAATLAGSWVNYSPATNPSARYTRDASGFVHLSGLVRGGSSGSTILTLPPEYRPSASGGAIFPTVCVVSGSIQHSYIVVTSAGVITCGQSITGSGDWVTLDGISFLAEN